MAAEALQQLDGTPPTHAFLPVGVGGLAAAVVAPLWQAAGADIGHMVSVESHMSACMADSIAANAPTPVNITEETLMAGLSCGEVSDLAWDILRPTLTHCATISDEAVAPLMRWFHARTPTVESGECSTTGLATLLQAHADETMRSALGLTADSVVMLIGTEGATDPEFYAHTIAGA